MILRHRGYRLRRQPGATSRGRLRSASSEKEPVAEFSHCQGRDRRKSRGVVRIGYEAGDLVILVGDHGLVEKAP